MLSLKGKTVFITGASAGIGKATAVGFAKAGSRVILCARRDKILKDFQQEIKDKYGIESLIFYLDVRHWESVKKAIEHLPAEWQEIDILINNAGLSRGMNKIHEGEVRDWDEMIDTNIKGLIHITKAVLPGMIKRNEGHIVNLGSIAGHEVYTGGNVYCATKHAVRALSNSFRLDVFGTNIRVTCISPGAVETEFSVVRFHGDKNKADQVYKGMTPLTAEDIADTIIYSCSRPKHVNISEILIMPTDQAAASVVNRKK